jgi:hypothetical protein
VRIILGTAVAGWMLGVMALMPAPAAAQDQTEVLMPEQSTAKAKELIHLADEALGGSAYFGVHDVVCTGRLGQFGHSGEMMGYEKFIDYEKLPDKDRNENLPKRNIIEIFNGKEGWLLDRGGVSEQPDDSVSQFQEDQKVDIDNILRYRWKEPNSILRYLGTDVVDLKEAEWIEFVDSENRSVRIAFAKATHLPIRKTVVMRDPGTHLRSEMIEYYSNYHPLQGVTTPFQITRERNHQKVYQVFFEDCKYNTNPSDALFTKASLDERWQQVGKSTIKKQEKQKQRDEQEEKKQQQDDKGGSSSSSSSSSSN